MQELNNYIPEYKLLVLDVDGTLVKDNSQDISAKVVKSIKSLKDKIAVSLCTGRSLEDLGQIIAALELEDSYHVVESGSKVLSPGLNVEFVKSVNKNHMDRFFKLSGPLINKYSICVSGTWLYDIEEVKNSDDIATLTFYVDDASRAEEAKEYFAEFEDIYNIVITSQWGNPNGRQIMITNKEASKEKSLEYIQNKLGIEIKNTACIGDMPNDIPMFKRSGLKISVGNADQKLKDISDLVVKSVEDDGVSEAIELYIKSNRLA